MTVEGKGKGNMVPVNLVEPTRCDDALRWLSHRSDRQPKTYVKPEAAITVFELLMMGGVSSET